MNRNSSSLRWISLLALMGCNAACTSSESTDDEPGTGGRSDDAQTGGTQGEDPGSGGARSGTGGSSSGGAEASAGGTESSTGGTDAGTGGGVGLDALEACFEGVPAGEGTMQDAIKSSADGDHVMRLRLETADRFGTSGTTPYLPVRLGLLTPSGLVCVTDTEALAAAYSGSRHNCDDVLEIVDGERRYVINNPDSAVDYVDNSKYRRPGTLTIFENDVQVGEPIRIETSECLATSRGDGKCYSGGPCL